MMKWAWKSAIWSQGCGNNGNILVIYGRHN
jgi:hypothetical protein